jgi:glucose-1-phosphate thymidylyltransferase
MMWGIIPAAGKGSRIQPLAFSKELLPVGSLREGPIERPCAVSEYLLDRMIRGGARKICFVISPGKCDIIQYFGAEYGPASIAYVVQPEPLGLCDAIFRAAPLIAPTEGVVVGLPDTVWFPNDALSKLPDDRLSFLLFPVAQPQVFDAVIHDSNGAVREIQVKHRNPDSSWIWGAFKMPGHVLEELRVLWHRRNCDDEFVGSLVNAYLAEGGTAHAVRAGSSYVDVGTLHGYREAISLLSSHTPNEGRAAPPGLQLRIRREQTPGAVG